MGFTLNISPEALAVAGVTSLTLYSIIQTVRFAISTQRPERFPPGPSTLPLIGNLHQVPLDKPFLKFHELSKIYGDIVGLKLGPKNFVIISSPEYVRELFQKRGSKYSNRPYTFIPIDHVMKPGDDHFLFMPDQPRLRRWRKSIRHMLNGEGVSNVTPLLACLSQRLVYNVMEDPAEFNKFATIWALANPFVAIAGQEIDDYGPEFAEIYTHAQHKWLELLEPGKTPPHDVFPLLKLLPHSLFSWKKLATQVHEALYGGWEKLLKAAQENEQKGVLPFTPLFVRILRQQEGKDPSERIPDNELVTMGGGLIDAAVDSTLGTMRTILFCLVAAPEKLKRVQDEIDSISVDGKFPDSDAVLKLPYLKACILEALRFRTPAPLLIPRETTADDDFMGYHIPAGTTVVANIHTIHTRDQDYESPELFLPERYLDDPCGVRAGVPTSTRLSTYSFGAGRRACPGEAFAAAAVSITLARLLWAFDLEYHGDGKPDLSWETGYSAGLAMQPLGFEKVAFVVRGEARREEIVAEYRRTEKAMTEMLG